MHNRIKILILALFSDAQVEHTEVVVGTSANAKKTHNAII